MSGAAIAKCEYVLTGVEPIAIAVIAAPTVGRDEPVVTRNVSEFDRVDGLTVSPY